MTDDDILRIARHPETPTFIFGSEELKQFRLRHSIDGRLVEPTGPYVVRFLPLDPLREEFSILSFAWPEQVMPVSFDIPSERGSVQPG